MSAWRWPRRRWHWPRGGPSAAIGLEVGALGFGAEHTHSLTDWLAFRGGVYGSELGVDVEEFDIEYEADVVSDSVVAGGYFHPLDGIASLCRGS